MQNAGIAELGLNWRYLAFDVHPDHLGEAIEGARRMNFIGLNLTVPHKLLAMDLVDELDASAATWGAVNTIRFEGKDGDGGWKPLIQFKDDLPGELRSQGFNTDADAITASLREDLGLEVSGCRAVVLGAGGAGRVAAVKLAAEGASELFLVNRTESKAVAVAQEIREHYPAVQVTVGYPTQPVDILINATSLGLQPDDPVPLDANQFAVADAKAVFDMVYRPAETPLLALAREAGCRRANGLGMLLYQGARALEIWTGQAAPIGTMRAALEAEIYGS